MAKRRFHPWAERRRRESRVGLVVQDAEPPDEADARDEVVAMIAQDYEAMYPPGVRPALRDQHAKSHGCVHAEFVVDEDLPEHLRHGLFASPGRYPAWIRFSASSPRPHDDSRRDAHGMAIKVMEVPAEVLDADEDVPTQDFVLANSNVFFCRDAEQYVALTAAASRGRLLLFFFPSVLPWRWRLRQLLNMVNAIRRRVDDPLAIRYWSQTAYALGPRAVKYSAAPVGPSNRLPAMEGPDKLRRAMAHRLATEHASFDFMVQVQTDAHRMPVDDPTRAWSERRSSFVKVATCTIPPQQFDTAERRDLDEHLSFNPWHCLVAHRPLGGINRVRRPVYHLISQRRHDKNGVAGRQPELPPEHP